MKATRELLDQSFRLAVVDPSTGEEIPMVDWTCATDVLAWCAGPVLIRLHGYGTSGIYVAAAALITLGEKIMHDFPSIKRGAPEKAGVWVFDVPIKDSLLACLHARSLISAERK